MKSAIFFALVFATLPACTTIPGRFLAGKDRPAVAKPSDNPGMYMVPPERRTGQRGHGVLVSAFYFDPKSLRAAFDGKVIRARFEYRPDLPVIAGTDPPPGLVSWGVVNVPAQPPGDWVIEGTGTPKGGGGGINYLRWYKVTAP